MQQLQNFCGINTRCFRERREIDAGSKKFMESKSKDKKNLRNLVYIQCKAHLKFSSHMLPVHVFLIFGDQAYLSNFKIYRNGLRLFFSTLESYFEFVVPHNTLF